MFIHVKAKNEIHSVDDKTGTTVFVAGNTVKINPAGTSINFKTEKNAAEFIQNLASAIADGEKIYILTEDETNPVEDETDEDAENRKNERIVSEDDKKAAEEQALKDADLAKKAAKKKKKSNKVDEK